MIILFHPGNVNMLELAGLVFSVLFVLWILNSLYEWLKQKPWQKKQIPELSEHEEQQVSHDSNEHPAELIKLSTKLI